MRVNSRDAKHTDLCLSILLGTNEVALKQQTTILRSYYKKTSKKLNSGVLEHT